MLFTIISIVLQLLAITFVIYKTLNYIDISQKRSMEKEQANYVVTSWVLYLGFSSLKCSCTGNLGFVWNLLIQGALIFSLLNTKLFHRKIFEENTCEQLMTCVKSQVEKYLPKQKAE